MRLLLDECLPTGLVPLLAAAGHDCVHVYELGMGGQADEQIMATAAQQNRILVSADTDFGELLANAPVLAPSVILLRRVDKRADPLSTVLLANSGKLSKTLPQARSSLLARYAYESAICQ